MKKNGISKAMTSISTPGVNIKDRAFSKDLARFCNEYSVKLVSDYPEQFGAFAVLPLYDTGDALKEMEYALDTLHLAGVALLTNIDGIYLGDPKYDDLFAELNRRNIVVHIHPHDPPFGTIPNLKFPNAIIEAPFDTTRAITNMIHTGTMDRYKNIKFILSHAGGAIPFLAWRIALLEYQQTNKKLPFQALYDFLMTKRGPSAGLNILSRLYYDTAVAANPMALRSVQELVDTSHILFGTDYVWGQSWLTPIFIKALREYDGFNKQDLAAAESGNANRLFS
jgi:predicted TIM-barrel fold metal-dependent hydrolase